MMFSFHITRECAATWLVRRRLQSLPERNERCKQSSDQLLEQPIPFWRDVCLSRPLRCRPPATEQGRRLMPNFLWAAIAAGALASTGILSASPGAGLSVLHQGQILRRSERGLQLRYLSAVSGNGLGPSGLVRHQSLLCLPGTARGIPAEAAPALLEQDEFWALCHAPHPKFATANFDLSLQRAGRGEPRWRIRCTPRA
jgi:hypothetical protein